MSNHDNLDFTEEALMAALDRFNYIWSEDDFFGYEDDDFVDAWAEDDFPSFDCD